MASHRKATPRNARCLVQSQHERSARPLAISPLGGIRTFLPALLLPCLFASTLRAQEPTVLAPESFPIAITNSGAYRLVGDVAISQTGVDGLSVRSDDVTIDLGGFTLSGPGEASGSGIAQDASFKNLCVSNGVVAGWGGGSGIRAMGRKSVLLAVTANSCDTGLRVGRLARLEDCTPYSNATAGAVLDEGSLAVRCTAYGNGIGMEGGRDSEFKLCTSYGNRDAGFRLMGEADMVSCTANDNGTGMHFGEGVDASLCVAHANKSHGVVAESGCNLNETTANENGGDGLRAGSGCEIRSSTAFGNAMAGIHLTGASNVVVNSKAIKNEHGILATSTGNVIDQNICGGNNVKDFDVVEGNDLSPVLNETEALARPGERFNITAEP